MSGNCGDVTIRGGRRTGGRGDESEVGTRVGPMGALAAERARRGEPKIAVPVVDEADTRDGGRVEVIGGVPLRGRIRNDDVLAELEPREIVLERRQAAAEDSVRVVLDDVVPEHQARA